MNVSDKDALNQIRNLFTELRVFRSNRHIYGGCVQRIPGAWGGDWKADYNTRVIILVSCSELNGGFKIMDAVTFINDSTYRAHRRVLSSMVTDVFIAHLQSIVAGSRRRFNKEFARNQIVAMRTDFINGDETIYNSFMNYVFPLKIGPEHCFDTKHIVDKTIEFFDIPTGNDTINVKWVNTTTLPPAPKPKPKSNPKSKKFEQVKPDTPKDLSMYYVPPEDYYKSKRYHHYASNAWKYLFKPNPSSIHPYIEFVDREDNDIIYTDIEVTVYILQAPTCCKSAIEAYRKFIRPEYHSLIDDVSKDIIDSSRFKKLKIPFNFFKVTDVIVISDYRLNIKFSLRV